MLKDKLLVWKFKRGDADAALRVYAKYRDYLLTLAAGLLHDRSSAEDVVHNVFVSFAECIGDFELTGSLKSYLAVCVANRVRNINKLKSSKNVELEAAVAVVSAAAGPEQIAVRSEDIARLEDVLKCLPYEQKEAVVLHLKGGMKFMQIAEIQDVSINTVQSRYRYGIEKLRSLLSEGPVK
jgi:RNA polymerase sigma-70 factor (ECF subfamily)